MDAKPSETRPTGSSCRLITCSDLKQLGLTFEEKRAACPYPSGPHHFGKSAWPHPSACDNCFTAQLLSDPLVGECVLQLVVSMGCPSNLGCSLAVTNPLFLDRVEGKPKTSSSNLPGPKPPPQFWRTSDGNSLHPLNATNSVLSATALSSTTETKENTWACLKMRYL